MLFYRLLAAFTISCRNSFVPFPEKRPFETLWHDVIVYADNLQCEAFPLHRRQQRRPSFFRRALQLLSFAAQWKHGQPRAPRGLRYLGMLFFFLYLVARVVVVIDLQKLL